MPPFLRAASLAVGSIILLAAVVACLSSLSAAYASVAWGSVAVGALAGCLWGRRRSRGAKGSKAIPSSRLKLLDLAILAQVAAATTQILVAVDLPATRFLSIHDTPGVSAVYLALACILAFISVTLAVHQGDRGRTLATLVAACVFSSNLYLRAFGAPEAGPVYGPVFVFALLAAATLSALSCPEKVSSPNLQLDRSFTLGSAGLLAALAIAAIVSPVPGQSLDYLLRLAVLIGLSTITALAISSQRAWRFLAWGIVILAGALPILIALVKFVSLIPSPGFVAALSYRLNPNEFGGANLVARSILCVVPLALTLTRGASRQAVRLIGPLILVGGLFVVVYSRSWEGLFALLVAVLSWGLLIRWMDRQAAGLQSHKFGAPTVLIAILLIVMLIAGLAFAVALASRLNVESFNARFMHWQAALLAWQENPWLGNGPGNEAAYTPYAEGMTSVLVTQSTLDDPLHVVELEAGGPLRHHAHNVFLEFGAGAGLVGWLGLASFLVALTILGSRVWRTSQGPARLWVAGCLAGITGALAWGMLDVLAVTPPLLSFPVWGLLGLLLSLTYLNQPTDGEAGNASGRWAATPGLVWPVVRQWMFVLLATLMVLLPTIYSYHYTAGYLAFQERRWQDAASYLESAARYGLLAKPRQLLAEAYIAQGDLQAAGQAYGQAFRVKQDYSLYLSQLGLLAWLKGDLLSATRQFEQAVIQDPGEVWNGHLHADLGLAYAAQGDDDRARRAFADAVELDPTSVLASPWVLAGDGSAGNTIILDPAYVEGPSPELEKRILSHLGAPDVTERVFAPIGGRSGTLNLGEVLDTVEADYHEAAAQGSREAPLILAALAEASRLAGFEKRAEGAYREFQALQPESAYGFRDLGVLCRDQGRLEEAQAWLERAVEVSPRDVDSRYNLALVYMDRELWVEAEQALDTIMSQSLTTLFRSRFFDADLHAAVSRLQRSVGDEEGALEASRRAAEIRGGPADYLAVADLYRALGRPAEVTGQCLQAWEALARTWPRPLDPLLWEMGTCLASSPGEELAREMSGISRREPLAGNVLVGHVHRVRGELDLALAAYQAAAAARPDEGAPHYFLGETYQALGRPEEAEAEYRQAAALDPLESLPLLSLGRMQWGQGWQEAALESYRAAVEATPGWGPAQVALGNALLALGDIQGAAQHYLLAQRADRNLREGLVHDLAAELVASEIEAPGPGYVQNDYFNIDGDERRVLFMHPDSRARYTVDLPAGAVLSFALATGPDSWQQPGDGVTFVVRVETKEGAQEVFSTYIDPKGDQAARRWHPFEVDLEDYGGQSVILVLETGAGPAGDSRFDWAGWGRPQVLVP